jgi:hypothetical protein
MNSLFHVAVMALLLILATSHEALAQYLAWAKTIDSAYGDSTNSIVIDPSGNLVIGGTVGGRADFGGSMGTGIDGAGGYIAKYDQFRNPLWLVRHRGLAGSSVVNAVATDGNSVFATGSFVGTIDFGSGPITSNGYPTVIAQNAFVAAYSAWTGQFRWLKVWGSGRDSIGYGAGVVPNGDVIVTGTAAGRFTMGDGCGIPQTSSSSNDIFLVRFEGGSGYCKWMRVMGGPGDDAGTALAVGPLGDVTIAGRFQGAVDFGGAVATASGLSDLFVARYRPGGVLRWVRNYGGSGDDVARSVAVNPAGEIAVGGHFSGSVDFGGVVLNSAGSWDGFVLKVGPGGMTRWAWALGGGGTDEVFGVDFAPDYRVVVTGGFQSAANLGAAFVGSAGSWDGFATSFGPDGDPNWSITWGGAGTDLGQAIAVDGAGVAIIGGYYSEQAAFAGLGVLYNAGNADAFIIGVQ